MLVLYRPKELLDTLKPMDSASYASNYIVLDWFTLLKSPVWWIITMHHEVLKYKTNQNKGSWLGIGYK